VILDIDIGNTRCKWCVTQNVPDPAGQIQQASQISVLDFQAESDCAQEQAANVFAALRVALDHFFGEGDADINRVRVASVKSDDFERAFSLQVNQIFGCSVEYARTQKQTPFFNADRVVSNSYSQTSAMGVDRWCAIVAATQCYMDRYIVVVDSGSALTIECIDNRSCREGSDSIAAQAQHLGGYIIPGFEMQVNALLANTDRVAAQDVLKRVGRASLAAADNTVDAVGHGIWLGLVAVIKETVSFLMKKNNGDVVLVFTGGDGQRLFELLGSDTDWHAEYNERLVFDGLCYLLP